jgi:hypothetical protein
VDRGEAERKGHPAVTDRFEVSPRLAEWASGGGWGVSEAEDGRPMFWKEGGQLRYFIGRGDDGWFVITQWVRGDPEQFVLAAPSMDTIERHLFGDFGPSVRRQRRLPDVRRPIDWEEMAPGFTFDTRTFGGVEDRIALIDSAGAVVAISSSDPVTASFALAGLSVYVSATVDDIVASFLDPEGKPLFSLR